MAAREQERKAADATRDRQLQDIRTSLSRASDLIEESRRELARSQQLARDVDDLNAKIKADLAEKEEEDGPPVG